MAIILQEGSLYKDRFGYEHSDYYSVIDEVVINKNSNKAYFRLNIFKDKQARIDKKTPIEAYDYNINEPSEFEALLVGISSYGVYSALYNVVMNDLRWVNWKSDEV